MKSTLLSPRVLAVVGLVFAYFVVYPDDLEAVAAPVNVLAGVVENLLQVSNSISPWLYMVAAVGILAWTAVRVWGRSSRETTS